MPKKEESHAKAKGDVSNVGGKLKDR